jgi:small subunit ribosomal protein S3
MLKDFFIKEGIKEAEMDEFLREIFDKAGYSHSEVQRTPIGTRIIVFVHKPGIAIGRGERKLKEITEIIKEKFGLENPMLDVKEVENPLLDAQIVASRIAKVLERGVNYKKVANYYVEKVMEAGAVGVEIRIGGKVGGERGRFQKFRQGYIKHSGHYAETLVDKGFATALTKPGVIGVQVKILKQMPKDKLIELEEKEDEGKGNKKTER